MSYGRKEGGYDLGGRGLSWGGVTSNMYDECMVLSRRLKMLYKLCAGARLNGH